MRRLLLDRLLLVVLVAGLASAPLAHAKALLAAGMDMSAVTESSATDSSQQAACADCPRPCLCAVPGNQNLTIASAAAVPAAVAPALVVPLAARVADRQGTRDYRARAPPPFPFQT